MEIRTDLFPAISKIELKKIPDNSVDLIIKILLPINEEIFPHQNWIRWHRKNKFCR